MAILIVADDDPIAAQRIAEILEGEGFAVVRALVPDGDVCDAVHRVHAWPDPRRPREPGPLEVAGLRVDPMTRRVWRDGRPVELSPREFDLLAYLLRRVDEVVHRETLFEAARHYRHERSNNVVEVHVTRLRRKLDAPPLIHTVRGVGYVLSADPR